MASRFTELIYRRKTDGEIDRMHKDVRFGGLKGYFSMPRIILGATFLVVSGPKRPIFAWSQAVQGLVPERRT